MTRVSTAICCTAALLCGPLQAAPMTWSAAVGGNGHCCELVARPNITWIGAKDAAAGMTHLGAPGPSGDGHFG